MVDGYSVHGWMVDGMFSLYMFLKFTIVGLQTMFKLLLILFVIHLYARIDIYKF